MAIWINFLTLLGSLCVLTGVTHSAPTGADQVSQQPTNFRIPFSLDLEPPHADVANNHARLSLKDSYGNPIQPAALGVDPIATNFGLENPTSSATKKTVLMQGISFPIPSYASGITEIRKPSDGLLPPIDSSEVLTAPPNTPLEQPDSNLLQPLGNAQDALNEISGKALQERFGSDFNVQQLPTFVNSLQHLNNPPIPAVSAATPQPFSSGPQTPAAGTGKYTGGFGGARGILGDQNQIGYAVKPEGASASPSSPSVPADLSQQEQISEPANGKYTGGFGGPPGILVPYDNVNKNA